MPRDVTDENELFEILTPYLIAENYKILELLRRGLVASDDKFGYFGTVHECDRRIDTYRHSVAH